MPKTRGELIQLVERIRDFHGDEADHTRLLNELDASVPHPAPTDLIYFHQPRLSAEEIVDAALAYEPIRL